MATTPDLYAEFSTPEAVDPYAEFSAPVAAPEAALDSYAEFSTPDAAGQSTPRNVVNAAARGATEQGFYSGVEGVARAVSDAPVAKVSDKFADWATEKVQGFPLTEEQKATRQKLRAEAEQKFGGANRVVKDYADAVAGTRADLRTALPVDAEFEKSLAGQIVSGLGQAAGTLPLYAVPGAGPSVTIGQMYDQAYQDAKQSGADETTASAAGFANIPAAALDVAADKLIIGRILKPLKGRLTVGQVAKAVVASAASEGVTEGAQQLWQNVIARQLVGYDPERPLDDQVINSIIVGAVVGGAATSAGQAVTRLAAPAGTPKDRAAYQDVNAQLAEQQAGQGTEQAAAFGPDPYADFATPVEVAPNQSPAGMVEGQTGTPEAAPATPAPLSFDYTSAEDLPEDQRAVEQRMADIIKADPASALEAYRQANTRDGVLTIDADAARSLSPDYSASPEARGRLAAAVHEPASALVKLAYRQALAEDPRTGKVMFLAGGGGSGKTAVRELAGADTADVVYDSTFGNLASARARIKQALDSGRKIDINFVYRPQPLAWQGVEKRRLQDGRSVPFAEFQKAHESAFYNVVDLSREFAKDRRVTFKFFDNSGAKSDLQEVSWRDIARRTSENPKLDEQGAQLITEEITNGINEPKSQRAATAGAGGRQAGGETVLSTDGRGGPDTGALRRDGSGPAAQQSGDGRVDQPGESGGASRRGSGGPGQGRFVTRLPGGGSTVSGRWRVVDAARLVTSQDAGYAKELQPRDRTRAASEQQISAIVTNLDPELLGDSMTTDLGAPFIDKRGQVLSGNGRTLALRDAYAAGAPGFRYRLFVEQQAARYGIDPQDVAALERPMLVREVTDFGELSPTEFTRRSNQRQVLGMSESENAAADSQRLRETPALLLVFNPSADGDVLAASNREFLNQFIETTGDRAELVSRDGQGYSPKLAGRVRNAVLGVLLGSRERATLDQLIEAPDGLKKVVNGLLVSAPRLLRFQGTPYDLGPVLSKAVADYITLTRSGETVENYLSQGDMMRDRTRTPESDALLRVLGEARSTKRVADFFEAYARLAGQQDTTTDSMFGEAGARPMGDLIPLAQAAAESGGGVQAEFSRRTPQEREAARRTLAERQAEWKRNAERIAPGLMKSFSLNFGDPAQLVAMGRVDPRTLTGYEEAAYLGHERMFFLFDRALEAKSDLNAMINLLHEMGHAHWDTLPPARQAELLDLWRRETAGRTGPLYTGGKLKRDVAMGVESSLKEWYAERVAWANTEWARGRIGGAGLIGRMAQQFRQLLAQLKTWVEKLRGQPINADFRTFLNQGPERFAEVASDAPSRPQPVIAKLAGLVGIPALAQRGGSNYAIRAFHGTPHKVDKFSLSKVGTGEGAQVYGWGLYFAEERQVADHYRQKLSKGRVGNLYEVELVPDESTMLNWDASYDEQSVQVRLAIQGIKAELPEFFTDELQDRLNADFDELSGWEVYKALERLASETPLPNMAGDGSNHKQQVTEYLLSKGIKGIRYLDGASRRRASDGREVSRNFVVFDENLVKIIAEESAQFARRSPQQVADDSVRNIRSWLSRNMTSAAGLPAKVFEAKLAKDGRMASVAKQMQFALRDLDRAMHAVYGGYKAMTPAQLSAVNDVLGGVAPVASLDPRLAAPLATMRGQIDTLSARLVREGAIDAKLAAKVGGNVGFYLNRSYRKFDDPNWARNVPDAVRNRAESFIAAQIAAQNPGQPVNPAEVKGYVTYLLNKDTANESLYREPAKLGAKSLDVLTARKDIPPELRALMGEYTDPRVNYLRSVAKTAQILEANRFLRDVARLGSGSWLFPRPIEDASGSYTVPIAPKGGETMGSLNGLYTTKEIAEAFQGQMEAAPGVALRAWLRLNGWAKVSKTVLSPVTQVRNLAGNLGFLVAGGHWRADAAGDVWQALKADFGRGDTPAARDYLARLARLGVLGESVNAGELREALSDAGTKLQGFEEWTDSRLMRVAKSPFSIAARLYALNDEIFKIYAFENERRAWAKVDPTLAPEQLDAIAAERVRNTMPTYSLIPRAVQQVRRVGLTGSFLSFPSEIVRVTYHSISYALGDLAAANPRQKKLGAKRLVGLAMVAALPAAVSMMTRWLAGVDKKDEEDVRRFLPSWTENSTLYFTKADGRGRFGLIDASYLDPWNYLKKPLTAALRGEDWQTSLLDAGREALDPFAGEGLVTKALLDLARNRDDRDHRIFNPQAPFLDRAGDQLAHVWSVYEPGAVTQARRIVKGAKGEVAPGGRVYDLENEVAAVLTGARRQDIDVAQKLMSKVGRFVGEKQGAELLFKEVRDRRGTVEPAELEDARSKMEAARAKLYAEISADVAAAQRQGVSRGEVMQGLLGAGLGMQDAALILTGRYVPFYGQPDARQRALQNALLTR